MTAPQGLLLGVIQGVTEFLPVSSKGHLALAHMTLGLKNELTFDVMLHLATLTAILWFFRSTLQKLTIRQWLYLGIATIPVGLMGLLIEEYLDLWLRVPLFVMMGLLVTAGLNFFMQWRLRVTDGIETPPTEVFKSDKRKLLAVGIAQAVALLPGVSRSGTTLAAGLAVGLSKQVTFEWSFLLAIPAILAASLYQGWQVYSSSEVFPPLLPLTFGMIGAFTVGLLSLKLLKRIMQKDEFWIFGLYCLLLAGIVYWVGVR